MSALREFSIARRYCCKKGKDSSWNDVSDTYEQALQSCISSARLDSPYLAKRSHKRLAILASFDIENV